MVRDKDAGIDALAFGNFRLYPRERRLEREGRPVRIGDRALDILVALTGRAGEVVTKEELNGRLWPDVTVEESALRVHIAGLRKVLGDGIVPREAERDARLAALNCPEHAIELLEEE